ncbi:hypothetical protein [Burkholderia paludis]|uniref:hypothetical protein n=1 Tax=Burkholderia paludis TaxID=1506587 RepID=UPI00126A4B7B|nr:hypothetical protein [Burkholderia paludis]
MSIAGVALLAGCSAFDDNPFSQKNELMGKNITAAYTVYGRESGAFTKKYIEWVEDISFWNNVPTGTASKQFVPTGGSHIVGTTPGPNGTEEQISSPNGDYETVADKCRVFLVIDAKNIIVDQGLNSCTSSGGNPSGNASTSQHTSNWATLLFFGK